MRHVNFKSDKLWGKGKTKQIFGRGLFLSINYLCRQIQDLSTWKPWTTVSSVKGINTPSNLPTVLVGMNTHVTTVKEKQVTQPGSTDNTINSQLETTIAAQIKQSRNDQAGREVVSGSQQRTCGRIFNSLKTVRQKNIKMHKDSGSICA